MMHGHFLKKNTFISTLLLALLSCYLISEKTMADSSDIIFLVNMTINIRDTDSLHPGVNNVQYIYTPNIPNEVHTYQLEGTQYEGPNGYGLNDTGVKKLYIAWGYMGDNGPLFNTYDDTLTTPRIAGPVKFLGTFVTMDGKVPKPGEYDLTPQTSLNTISEYDLAGKRVGYHREMLQGHVKIIAASCATQTSNIIDTKWPSLSPSEIQNGSAESKQATVSVACNNAVSSPPMSVMITSKEGSSDETGGIIKTTLPNLGLKLRWASDNTPVQLNKYLSIPSPAVGEIQDLSVIAQPVATGSGGVSGGTFISTLTMSIEYP